MKRIATFFCLMAVLHFPTSCGCDSAACECEDFSSASLVSFIEELESETGTYDGYNFITHNSPDTLEYQTAAIQLEITRTQYKEQAGVYHFSMIQQAFACSPAEPEAQQIKSIKISSNQANSFNRQEYKSGEDLSELFYVANKECNSANCSSIADFLTLQNQRPYLFGYQGDKLIFMLKDKPDEIVKQQLTVEFTFTDSLKVAIKTDEIIIR